MLPRRANWSVSLWLAWIFAILLLTALNPVRAEITGKVFLSTGELPNPDVEIDVSKQENCREHAPFHTQNWRIGADRALGDVVVTLPGVPAPALPDPIILRKENCRFDRRVIVIPPGTRVRFETRDPGLQNVRGIRHEHGKLGRNLFNFGLTERTPAREYTFDQSGIYRVESDIYRWMRCWIVVTNDYGVVTDEDGQFTFPQSAAASVRFWHPQFPQSYELSVTSEPVQFTFQTADASPAVP